MSYPTELLELTKRLIWFGTPEAALEIPNYFLTYLMTFGEESEINIARKYYSDEDFKTALEHPAPGVFSREAWTRWNVRYNRVPVPPLPKREIPGVDPECIPDFFPR